MTALEFFMSIFVHAVAAVAFLTLLLAYLWVRGELSMTEMARDRWIVQCDRERQAKEALQECLHRLRTRVKQCLADDDADDD